MVGLEDEAVGRSLKDPPRDQRPDAALRVGVFEPQVLGGAPSGERPGHREHEGDYPPLDAGKPQADRKVRQPPSRDQVRSLRFLDLVHAGLPADSDRSSGSLMGMGLDPEVGDADSLMGAREQPEPRAALAARIASKRAPTAAGDAAATSSALGRRTLASRARSKRTRSSGENFANTASTRFQNRRRADNR